MTVSLLPSRRSSPPCHPHHPCMHLLQAACSQHFAQHAKKVPTPASTPPGRVAPPRSTPLIERLHAAAVRSNGRERHTGHESRHAAAALAAAAAAAETVVAAAAATAAAVAAAAPAAVTRGRCQRIRARRRWGPAASCDTKASTFGTPIGRLQLEGESPTASAGRTAGASNRATLQRASPSAPANRKRPLMKQHISRPAASPAPLPGGARGCEPADGSLDVNM